MLFYFSKKSAEVTVRKIDDSATQLSVLCKAPVKISEATACTISLHAQIKELFYGLRAIPDSAGIFYKSEVFQAGKNLLESIYALAESIVLQHRDPAAYSEQREAQLISTKKLWNSCKKFSMLPKDNATVVAKNIRQITSIIEDSLNELNEALASNSREHKSEGETSAEDASKPTIAVDFAIDETGLWNCPKINARSHPEEEIIADCKELISKMNSFLTGCLQNVIEPMKSLQSITLNLLIDDLCEEALKLQQIIDALISAVYEPIELRSIAENAIELVRVFEAAYNFLQLQLSDVQSLAWTDDFPPFFSTRLAHLLNKIPDR